MLTRTNESHSLTDIRPARRHGDGPNSANRLTARTRGAVPRRLHHQSRATLSRAVLTAWSVIDDGGEIGSTGLMKRKTGLVAIPVVIRITVRNRERQHGSGRSPSGRVSSQRRSPGAGQQNPGNSFRSRGREPGWRS